MAFQDNNTFWDIDENTMSFGNGLFTIGLPGGSEEPEETEYYDTPAPTNGAATADYMPLLLGSALVAAFYFMRS